MVCRAKARDGSRHPTLTLSTALRNRRAWLAAAVRKRRGVASVLIDDSAREAIECPPRAVQNLSTKWEDGIYRGHYQSAQIWGSFLSRYCTMIVALGRIINLWCLSVGGRLHHHLWRFAQHVSFKPQSGVALREWPLVRPRCEGVLVGRRRLLDAS